MSLPPPPETTDVATRVASTLELWAKVGGSLAILWGFVARVVKPFIVWRREQQAKVVREVLAPELHQLATVQAELRETREHEDGCAGRMERVLESLREFFSDHDRLITIALDDRDRLDEVNELLNALGFSSERRTDDERRRLIDEMVAKLTERRAARHRDPDALITPAAFPRHHPPLKDEP